MLRFRFEHVKVWIIYWLVCFLLLRFHRDVMLWFLSFLKLRHSILLVLCAPVLSLTTYLEIHCGMLLLDTKKVIGCDVIMTNNTHALRYTHTHTTLYILHTLHYISLHCTHYTIQITYIIHCCFIIQLGCILTIIVEWTAVKVDDDDHCYDSALYSNTVQLSKGW